MHAVVLHLLLLFVSVLITCCTGKPAAAAASVHHHQQSSSPRPPAPAVAASCSTEGLTCQSQQEKCCDGLTCLVSGDDKVRRCFSLLPSVEYDEVCDQSHAMRSATTDPREHSRARRATEHVPWKHRERERESHALIHSPFLPPLLPSLPVAATVSSSCFFIFLLSPGELYGQETAFLRRKGAR